MRDELVLLRVGSLGHGRLPLFPFMVLSYLGEDMSYCQAGIIQFKCWQHLLPKVPTQSGYQELPRYLPVTSCLRVSWQDPTFPAAHDYRSFYQHAN
jgi:hypothetical protein